MKDILKKITECRLERGWTEYHLAERSEVPQSTISSWYRKGTLPSLTSLDKICTAFGLTLSQLLAESDDLVSLTESQKAMLDRWSRLTPEQQEIIFQLLDIM